MSTLPLYNRPLGSLGGLGWESDLQYLQSVYEDLIKEREVWLFNYPDLAKSHPDHVDPDYGTTLDELISEARKDLSMLKKRINASQLKLF